MLLQFCLQVYIQTPNQHHNHLHFPLSFSIFISHTFSITSRLSLMYLSLCGDHFTRLIIDPCTHMHYVFIRWNYKIVFLVVMCVGTSSLTTLVAGFSFVMLLFLCCGIYYVNVMFMFIMSSLVIF